MGESCQAQTMPPGLWKLTSCDRWLMSDPLRGSEMVFRPGTLTCSARPSNVGACGFTHVHVHVHLHPSVGTGR